MTSKMFVYIDGLDDVPVICGVFQYLEGKEGRFRYGARYLARENAFSLDPVRLP